MRNFFSVIIFFILTGNLFAQENFSVTINPIYIGGLPGLHSFAFATSGNKWLIIGGRLNGLHGFQPPIAFPASTANQTIYVNPSYKPTTGTFSIGKRKNWLYSKRLYPDPNYLKTELKGLLQKLN